MNPGLESPRRQLALFSANCAMVLTPVSLTSISLALPVMAPELGVEPATAVWLVSAFQLVLLSTLLPFAALGERFGYRRLFVSGLLLVSVGCIVAALAPDFRVLVAARVAQGLGASAAVAVTPALVRLSVPAHALGHALGVTAMAGAVALAIGPTLAAVVLAALDWRWIFALHVLLALPAALIGLRTMPNNRGAATRFDKIGAALNVVAFVLLAWGFGSLADRPLHGLLLLAVGGFAAFVLFSHQRRRVAPVLPLDLMENPVVRACVGATVFAFAAQVAALVALPFLLHEGLQLDMVHTGALLAVWPLAVAAMAPISAWCETRLLSSFTLSVLGCGLLCAGLVIAAMLPWSAGPSSYAAVMVLCGAGFGLFQTPNNRALYNATPLARSGSAGGLQGTARLMGQTLGAMLVGMSLSAFQGQAARAAGWALLAAAACAGTAAICSLQRRSVQPLP